MASEWDVVSQTPVKGGWEVVSHTPTPPETSTLGQIGRGFGLGARDVVQGVASLPGLVYDVAALPVNAGIAGYNALTGGNQSYIPSGSHQVGRILDAVGLPKAESTREKFISESIQGAAGALTGVGAAGAVAPALTGVGQGVARVLASQPAMQVASGAVVGGVGGATDNPVAGLIAGALTPVGVAGARRLITSVSNVGLPGSRAANEVRASAIKNSSNLANNLSVAAGAEDANGVTGVANANAQAARFGEESFFANKKAGQFGDAASRAAGAEAVAETPRSPVASPFGEPPSSAGIGQSVQSAAIDREARLRLVRGSDYAENTAEVQKAVDAKEARGIFLINDPEAQRMLKQSLRALDDTPIPGRPAAERLSASDRMAHEAVVSALKGLPVKIPESMVPQMRKEGRTVVSSPGEARPLVAGRGPNGQFGGLTPPTFSVTFSNTVDGVNNVRRMFGEAFNSDAVGWGAINSSLKKGIYGDFDNVLRSYVGDAYTVRQAKYRDASSLIDAYGTKIGKQLTADQKRTTQPSTTPNALADLLNQADPAVIDEVRKLSGIDPMPGIVARAFHDPVTGMSIPLDAALKATARGTKLADALAAHPELNAAVIKHVSALKTEENATIQQSLFAQQQGAIYAQKLSAEREAINRANAATKGQTKAKELAEKLRETSAKNAGKLREEETAALQDIANLERMSPKEVLPYARAMLERMSPAKGGHLTMDQYTAALAQLDKAKSTADLQRRLLRIVGAGLAIAGTPAAGRVVYNSITGGP